VRGDHSQYTNLKSHTHRLHMIHPDTELRFIHPDIGFGVVATRHIPKGTITWVQDELDQVFTAQKLDRLGELYEGTLRKYTFVNGRGEYVLCWDVARYINHSCHATCLSAGYNFEIAVRDIEPGEELTDDYATLNLEGSFDCRCGVRQCRTTIREQDIYAHAERWDSIVRDAFPLIQAVPQPLWPLVEEKEAVQSALSGASTIVSCKFNLRGYQQT
jgi:uncharacterized protein